ncbi:MFS transporter [Providencia stuartii]|uniref:MFS transporter n=1 Tax=Providencia TaxID=586 RepID=UPI0011231D8D|nr:MULTISPECIES: MFS transporter [Providencia]ELR5301018.1 MFS transporter [Providencia stuartii]MDW7587905.1 MFS transporter [Providencia sp. 2023EL-00965]
MNESLHTQEVNDIPQKIVLKSSLNLLLAIIIFAAIAPGILMTAPAVASQLASQWQLSADKIGYLFSAELGAMSFATIPAWYWINRINWQRIAVLSIIVFIIGNLISAFATTYAALFIFRIIASLAGGTLMIICLSCAGKTENPSRMYAFWVLGQLILGTLGLLALPPLFEQFGLRIVYFILAALMIVSFPLIKAFPDQVVKKEQPQNAAMVNTKNNVANKTMAIIAILVFYICLSQVWTFIGLFGEKSGLNAEENGRVLAIATVLGIIGSMIAAAIASKFKTNKLVFLGYGLLIASILLLLDSPVVTRFIIAAFLFKFTWTFVLPFIMATVSQLDTSGRLMNNINLVIGGGMALGPAIGGYILVNSTNMVVFISFALLCSICSAILVACFLKRIN